MITFSVLIEIEMLGGKIHLDIGLSEIISVVGRTAALVDRFPLGRLARFYSRHQRIRLGSLIDLPAVFSVYNNIAAGCRLIFMVSVSVILPSAKDFTYATAFSRSHLISVPFVPVTHFASSRPSRSLSAWIQTHKCILISLYAFNVVQSCTRAASSRFTVTFL